MTRYEVPSCSGLVGHRTVTDGLMEGAGFTEGIVDAVDAVVRGLRCHTQAVVGHDTSKLVAWDTHGLDLWELERRARDGAALRVQTFTA